MRSSVSPAFPESIEFSRFRISLPSACLTWTGMFLCNTLREQSTEFLFWSDLASSPPSADQVHKHPTSVLSLHTTPTFYITAGNRTFMTIFKLDTTTLILKWNVISHEISYLSVSCCTASWIPKPAVCGMFVEETLTLSRGAGHYSDGQVSGSVTEASPQLQYQIGFFLTTK